MNHPPTNPSGTLQYLLLEVGGIFGGGCFIFVQNSRGVYICVQNLRWRDNFVIVPKQNLSDQLNTFKHPYLNNA